MNELNECMDVEYLDYEENKLYDRSLLAENSEHLSHKVDYSNLKLHQKCYKNKNPIHIILNYSVRNFRCFSILLRCGYEFTLKINTNT